MSHKYPFSEEVKEFLLKEYPIHGSEICAQKLNVPKYMVVYWVGPRKLKLPKLSKEIRSKIVRQKMNAGNGVDLKLFTENFTKESVYILGLIWADGNININKISITCSAEDAIDYADTFLKTGEWRSFESNHKRYEVKTKTTKTIYTGNRILSAKLKDFGYEANNKNSPDKLLSLIPEHLKHYWFRGLFDGDGCFLFGGSGTSALTITAPIEQNWNFIEQLSKKLGIAYKIRKNCYKNRHGKINSSSVFKITNAIGCKKFFDYIYMNRENDKIGLGRKHRKWLNYIEYAKMRPKIMHHFI